MKKLLTALALGSTLTAAAYAQRPQTDRDFDGLKGPVKSVTDETAALKKRGKRYVEERRVLSERKTYNADGNFAETESYDEVRGTLFDKAVFSYVGGEQIATGQRAFPLITIEPGLAATGPGGSQPAAPPSPPGAMYSYTEKFKYEYDAKGYRKEMTIESGGRVGHRVVYEFKGDRKETRWYEGDNLTVHVVERFDARGEPAETTGLDNETGAVTYKSSYTAYEFDARGNWVKRLKTVSAKGEPAEREVEYRTITYF